MTVIRVEEYQGISYPTPKNPMGRNDYIRFEWNTGYLEMKKYYWEKLSQSKKKKIYNKFDQKVA